MPANELILIDGSDHFADHATSCDFRIIAKGEKMKRRHAHTAVVAAMLMLPTVLAPAASAATTASAPVRPNLLVNSGFEQRAPKQALPSGWTADSWLPTGVPAWDDSVSHGGRRSARIEAPTPNDIRWVQEVAVLPHTRYRLSGWVKTVHVAHTTQLVDAGANLSFLGTWDRSAPVYGTQDWTHAAITIDSGDRTTLTVAARLGFWAGTTTGTAWFDDLSLVQAGG